MIIKKITISFVLIIILSCYGSELRNSFFSELNKIYGLNYTASGSQDTILKKLLNIYNDIFLYRIGKYNRQEHLLEKIEDLQDIIKKAKNFAATEENDRELIKGILYGCSAYVRYDDPSYKMLTEIKKARSIFDDLKDNSIDIDDNFGWGLSKLSGALFFEDSFWSFMSGVDQGDIELGENILKLVFFNGKIMKAEAGLFLIEYYSDILLDHRSSLKYSSKLHTYYSNSRYFKFLYAKDLYHTGSVKQAEDVFRYINNTVGEQFYPFEYSSMIYEIKCCYLTDKDQRARELLDNTSEIHDGYILENFRKKWMVSLKFRKEILYLFNNSLEPNVPSNRFERISASEIYREFSLYERSVKLSEASDEPEILIRGFISYVNIRQWQKALELYDKIEDRHEDFLKKYFDNERISLILNSVNNRTLN